MLVVVYDGYLFIFVCFGGWFDCVVSVVFVFFWEEVFDWYDSEEWDEEMDWIDDEWVDDEWFCEWFDEFFEFLVLEFGLCWFVVCCYLVGWMKMIFGLVEVMVLMVWEKGILWFGMEFGFIWL